jgi:hypothetical protein
MRKAILLVSALGVAAVGQAQPLSYVDLGTIYSTSSNYDTADLSFNTTLSGSTINWYKFTLVEGTSPTVKYLDIDLFATGTSGPGAPDTEIGVYDSLGNRIADDDDDGHAWRSALTFGNTTPRTMPPDPFGFWDGLDANGRDGNLAAGTYWLAIGLYNTTFGESNWTVTSNATGNGVAQVNFRTDAVPEPATMAALGLGVAALARRRARKS